MKTIIKADPDWVIVSLLGDDMHYAPVLAWEITQVEEDYQIWPILYTARCGDYPWLTRSPQGIYTSRLGMFLTEDYDEAKKYLVRETKELLASIK